MSGTGRGRTTRSSLRDACNGFEAWGGYMNAKKQKLQSQFSEETPGQLKKEGSGSKIFSGIRIHVNGYTKPSSDELKRLMMLHGGGYEHYLYRTRVTHVIATNLTNSKVKEIKGLKVVRPEWITDSIAAGKLLSYTKYLLYTAQSGLQKGLQTFTSRQNSNQSEGSLQSINSISSDMAIPSINEEHETINSTESDTSVTLTVDDHSTGNIVSSKVNMSKNATSTLKETSPVKGSVGVRNQVMSPGKTADARDPNFLNEYYSNSRLHFLSTWKAEWKSYVNELQSKGDNFPGRENLRRVVLEREVTLLGTHTAKLKGKPKKCVMHIDMDCFFVAVGLRKRPDLRGKPVAVTHSKGKGSVPDPESNLEFERHQWEQRRLQGGKKGKKGVQNRSAIITDVDTSFPDQSDSNSDDDVTTVTKTTSEPFHSMAEIASCSYEARKAGVKNGMFMGRAKAVCPELVTIPYDFEGYKAVSKILYDTVASYTHDIEAVSCDEMLVDCTDLLADTGATPTEFACQLRSEIYAKTGCPASAGLGSSILLARMATRKAKPNGQFYLTEELVGDYIKLQPVKDLPGVGWSTTRRFETMKVVTCGDLQKISLDTLQKEFGPKTGQSLYRYCRGQDDRPIKMEQQRKSVSAEVNYGIRFTTDGEAVTFLEELSEEVCSRLKSIKMKGKTVTLKLMVRTQDAPKQTAKFMGHGICDNFSKSVSLPMATDDSRIVAKETIGLLRAHRVNAADLRGIGIQVQKLENAEIGCHGNKKLPSILSYTVNKNSRISPTVDKSVQDYSDERGERKVSGKNSQIVANGVSCSKNGVTLRNDHGTCADSMIEIDITHENETTVNSNDLVRKSAENSEEDIFRGESEHAGDLIPEVNADHTSCRDTNGDNRSATFSTDDNLLDDLGRRQIGDTSLPPLPCLPDIKTPDSTKKSFTRNSPVVALTDAPEIDYFPSPSQVDPDVLNELPMEIREQIETELKQRKKRTNSRKKRTNSISSELSAPGCSHWQRETRGDAGIEEIQNEAEKHSHDAIVALPSPSQIDQSCLDALPESLQAELRQAYARQDSAKGGNSTKGANTLQLKQAQSPSKSPNKRSPGKGSPNFKVPRGRPGKRGRPRGSSKKTLFRDHTRTQHQQLPNHTSTQNYHGNHGNGSIIEIMESDETTAVHKETLQTGSSGFVIESTCDGMVPVKQSNNVVSDTSNTGNNGNREKTENCVNLCGAATLEDVRQLLKEWIHSTPVPQQEDEEVLQKYLAELITERNLEQVDLLLKFMLRRINLLHSSDWRYSLKRIFNHTQAAVYELYGSRLVSITL